MSGNDLQPRPDPEQKSGDEWIPEPDAIYVLCSRPDDKLAARLVTGEESVDHGKVNMRSGSDFARRGGALSLWRGLHKSADKPTAEPSGSNLLHRRIGFLFKRRGNGSHVRLVRDAQMLETLSHAPGARRRLPIELFNGESIDHSLRGLVIRSQLKGEPDGPCGVRFLLCRCSHKRDCPRL